MNKGLKIFHPFYVTNSFYLFVILSNLFVSNVMIIIGKTNKIRRMIYAPDVMK